MHRPLAVAFALIAILTAPASAQEFGVYTKVFNVAGATPKTTPEVIVRSLTLFRSGIAYDTIHSAGEVTIFDPSRRRYLEYADWTAKLNYLLHPRALFPAPRISLNRALKTRKLLPLKVELRDNSAGGFHLRAEHQYHWKLTGKDRDDILHWESLRTRGTLRRVKFAEYRRRLVSRR
jgi:hypothetical protein